MSKIEVRIKDKDNGLESKPVDIEEFILDPYHIEFVFSDDSTLPYTDFQFYSDDFEIIITVHEKELLDNDW